MNSNVQTRVRAVFLAAIMLASVVAMSGAFVGGAAAAVTGVTGQSADDIRAGQAGVIQDVTFDVTIDGASSSETITIDVSEVLADTASVDVSEDGSDVTLKSGDTSDVSVATTTDNAGGDGKDDDTIGVTLDDDTRSEDHTVTITVTLTHDTTGTDYAPANYQFTISNGDDVSDKVSFSSTLTVTDGDSIQRAVNAATAGSTITVEDGTYGPVTVDKDLTIKGPNAGIAGDSDQRGAEATITGKVNIGDQSETTLSGEIVINGIEMATTDSGVTDGVVSVGDRQQKVENVTITNSVIDTDLSQSAVGVGIYTEEVDNLTMENNAFTESGSGTSVAYNAAQSPVNTIEMSENTLTDVDRLYNEGAGFIEGRGISSTTVNIVDNDVNGATTAIGIGDSDDQLNSVDYTIEGNQIDASSVGILQNGGTPASFTIESNDFTGDSSTAYVDDEEKGILDLSAILNDQGNTFDGAVTVKDSSGNIISDLIYGRIQPAINDASSDDNISVGSDTYTPASAVEVDKSLTIKSASESNPIIDASGNAHGIEIPVGVSGVTINGLSISDSNGQGVIVKTESSSPEPSEPSADNHDNIEIRSNILSGHGDNGIYVGDTNSVTIVGNTLQNNGGDGEFDNAGNGVLLVGGNKDVNVNNNKFDANVDSGLYLDDFAGSGQTIPSVEGNEFTGHSEADFRIESASAAGSINGENDQSGQLQYVIDNNDITTTNPATVSDVQLTNPDQKQLDLSVTTTGDVSESNLVVQLSSSTDSTGSDVTITDGEFSETDNGDGSFTYDATVTADVSSGNTKPYQAVVDSVDNDPDPANALPTSESLDLSVASIGTDGSTTIDNTGSATVSSANIQSNADTSSGTVTTSVSNDVPSTGSQSQQNLEEDVSSVDENAQVVSAVNINPSDSTVESSSATLEFTLSRSNVGEPSNIRVVRFNDNTNSYESLPTSVVDTTSSEVTVQAQTTGFSLFAIVETAEPATVSPEPIESDPLNITAESDTVAVGENVTLTVTNDATGEPVADAAVELPSQTVRTNANGSVTVSFNTTGKLTLTTTGNIDASYSPDSLTLTVTEADTPSGSLIPLNFTADSESVVVGEELTLSVTNADTDEPVANLPIALPNQTIQTNANGSVTVTFNSTGNVTVETVGASDTYESNTLTITVEEASEIPEDAVYDPDSVAAEFDDDADGQISITELGAAGSSYASGELTISELSDVGRVFASG